METTLLDCLILKNYSHFIEMTNENIKSWKMEEIDNEEIHCELYLAIKMIWLKIKFIKMGANGPTKLNLLELNCHKPSPTDIKN